MFATRHLKSSPEILAERVDAARQQWACQSAADLRREFEQFREVCGTSPSPQYALRRRLPDSRFVKAAALADTALFRCTERHFYPTQLCAGEATVLDSIAEMQTGEGKTLVSILSCTWHALHNRQVHVATTNEYLAHRDWSELQPVFRALGISSGLVTQQSGPPEKKQAYSCDVVFGAATTFAFDFLRDQITRQNVAAQRPGLALVSRLRRAGRRETAILQPSRTATIVDEADSIFLDEAVTPLVLSAESSGGAADTAGYEAARQTAELLNVDTDFVIDRKGRSLRLTQTGWTRLHERVPDQCRYLARPWGEYVLQALRARHLYRRNVDYVVRDGEVQIVDVSTGRIQPERMWQDGLHQAIERQEGLPNSEERSSSARITRQRFYGLYRHLSGMTGTAHSAVQELSELYDLNVVRIPLQRPSRRQHHRTRWFSRVEAKYAAIVESVQTLRQTGRPILIGTATIEQSLSLSAQFERTSIDHVILNGLQDEEEAAVVAKAGESGRVTIATAMAGRGTDIRLDSAALAAGGLHVLATQHHESDRSDRQLIGRCARQGNPGSCQFFISAEDDLIADHAPALATRIQRSCPDGDESPRDFTADVSRIQEMLADRSRESRKRLLEHETWLDVVRSKTSDRIQNW